MKFETQCMHEGYTPANGAPRVMPIVQSTTYVFDSTDHIGDLFNLPNEHMYSRFSNPTVECVEKKIAALEGGVAAMCTSSGQAASLLSVINVCSAGDSFHQLHLRRHGQSICCDPEETGYRVHFRQSGSL